MTGHQTRAARARMPLAREVVRAAAVENGVCIRPVSVRKVDRVTGTTELVDRPCGATLASKCPSCAERARRLRIAQCREGWHLDAEPIHEAEPATVEQRTLATTRADLERARVDTEDAGEDAADVETVIGQVDELVAEAGVRGRIGAGAAHGGRRRRVCRGIPGGAGATSRTGGGLMAGSRDFGSIRRLPSGRWQARYYGPDGVRRTAPETFERKGDAARWLATTEAEMIKGEWRDPERAEQLSPSTPRRGSSSDPASALGRSSCTRVCSVGTSRRISPASPWPRSTTTRPRSGPGAPTCSRPGSRSASRPRHTACSGRSCTQRSMTTSSAGTRAGSAVPTKSRRLSGQR